jgi:hypothetical protein
MCLRRAALMSTMAPQEWRSFSLDWLVMSRVTSFHSRPAPATPAEAFGHLAEAAELAAIAADAATSDGLLEKLLELRTLLDACTASTVRAARASGAEWTDIGLALGMDPDEARQGFDHLDLLARRQAR